MMENNTPTPTTEKPKRYNRTYYAVKRYAKDIWVDWKVVKELGI